MIVTTYMEQLREKTGKSQSDVERALYAAGVKINRAYLSMLEHGQLIPKTRWIPFLEQHYGPFEEWYPKGVLAQMHEPMICARCGEALGAHVRRGTKYHPGRSCARVLEGAAA